MMSRTDIRHLKAPFVLLAALALLVVNGHSLAWREALPRTVTPIASSGQFDQAIVQQRDRSPALRNPARQPTPGTGGTEPMLVAGVDIPVAPAGCRYDGCVKRSILASGGASSYSARAPPAA